MKYSSSRIIILIACILSCYLSYECTCAINMMKPNIISIKKISDSTDSKATIIGNGALCPTCVDLLDFGLADLMAAIDTGVVFSCLKLCNYLTPYGEYAVTGCDVICDAVGVNTFIDIIKKADLDPIYGCQLANICPIHDCTAKVCAKADTFGIVPSSAPAKTLFHFYSRLTVFNESGPGQVTLMTTGTSVAANQEVSRYYQAAGFKPGVYGIKFSIDTSGNDGQEWFPGLYQAKLNVCEGECGSWIKRPHSRLLASAIANFTIAG